MASKQEIREKFLKKRIAIKPLQMGIKSAMASLKLLKLKEINFFKNILLYLPIKNEVETKYLLNIFFQYKKQIVLPVFNKKSWGFSKYSIDDNLVAGPFNIKQPKRIRPFNAVDLDLAILPGLAFSKNGLRLGYGKGIYDRLLKSSKCLKVGLCFDFQIVNKLKVDSHDVPVDIIVSEKRLIRVT